MAGLAGIVLAACSSGSNVRTPDIDTAEFRASPLNPPSFLPFTSEPGIFVGAVVADEPLAVLTGRGVLAAGGTAADAATAVYFTLAVTMPQSAGLGGGGICLVKDARTRELVSYDFLPRRARGGGPGAIPGNVRGFALIHGLHGSLAWSQLLAPAEGFAARGHEVSRASARELAGLEDTLRADLRLAARYLRPDGTMLREGDLLAQPGLAVSLGKLRANGPSGFYAGALAQAITENSGIDLSELHAYRPGVRPPQIAALDGQAVALPPAELGAGRLMGAALPAVRDGARGERLLAAVRAALAGAAPGEDVPPALGSTGFAVATAGGDAVACAVTMNGPFGTGRTVPGTGVELARSPDTPGYGLAPALLAPLIATAPDNGRLFFAGAAAGGPRAPAAVLHLAASTLGDSINLADAMETAPSDAESLVNAVACPRGTPVAGAFCDLAADPRGAGLGAVGAPAIQ